MRLAEPHGYELRAVQVAGCLHLKTAATWIPPHFLLFNPACIDPAAFEGVTRIGIAEEEPLAANTLTIGGTTLISASCPETANRLRAAGIRSRAVEISEFEKAEAGMTCMSLILEY